MANVDALSGAVVARGWETEGEGTGSAAWY